MDHRRHCSRILSDDVYIFDMASESESKGEKPKHTAYCDERFV